MSADGLRFQAFSQEAQPASWLRLRRVVFPCQVTWWSGTSAGIRLLGTSLWWSRSRPQLAASWASSTFAEANGPTPLYTMSINPDLTVNAWPGYFVAGYVRYIGTSPTSVVTTPES